MGVEDYPHTLLEMERRFASDEACRAYLFSLRWPEGFVCPRCTGQQAWPMERGLWLCQQCRAQVSVTAGTIFQDSRLPLVLWFRAVWYVTTQKNGVSALGLQRVLGLGSYKTAWTMLHKLRRAMIRPGRERLSGLVEVDEAYWGGDEVGLRGRGGEEKILVLVAAEADGKGIGRVRLCTAPDQSRKSLHGFIQQTVEPGSTVRTDGYNHYLGLDGYVHDRHIQIRQPEGVHVLPRVHRVISLLKRWLMGTHQGAISQDQLNHYLDEFTFRFNRRKSAWRGKLFYRLLQQAVQVEPAPYRTLIKPQSIVGG
jgi:transposase-like protein